jgi:hypothetical protein
MQWLDVGTDHLAKRLGIPAVATKRCHQDGDPCLMLHHELQHNLVEVRAMIATIALGGVNHLCLGLLVAVVVTIDMNARLSRCVEVGHRPKRLAALTAMRLYSAVTP